MAKIKLSDGNTDKKKKKREPLSKKVKLIIAGCFAVAALVVCSIFFTKDAKKAEAAKAYTITETDPAMLFDQVRNEAYEAEKETKE